ncbi:MAG: hypothetical protein Q9165_006068 [Trypethelium subeluteriae]
MIFVFFTLIPTLKRVIRVMEAMQYVAVIQNLLPFVKVEARAVRTVDANERERQAELDRQRKENEKILRELQAQQARAEDTSTVNGTQQATRSS